MAASKNTFSAATATMMAENQVKKIMQEMASGKNPALKDAFNGVLSTFKKQLGDVERITKENAKLDESEASKLATFLKQCQVEVEEGRKSKEEFQDLKEKEEEKFQERKDRRDDEVAQRHLNAVLAFKEALLSLFKVDQSIAATADLAAMFSTLEEYELEGTYEIIKAIRKVNFNKLSKKVEKDKQNLKAKIETENRKLLDAMVSSNYASGLATLYEQQSKAYGEHLDKMQKKIDESDGLAKNISDLSSQIQKLQADLNKKNSDLQYGSSLEFLEAMNGKTESEIEEARRLFDATSEDLRKERDDIQSQINELLRQRKDFEARKDSVDTEYASLDKEGTALRKDFERAKQESRNIAKKNDQLVQELYATRTAYLKAQNEQIEWETQLATQNLQLTKLQHELAIAEAKGETKRCKEINNQINQYKKDVRANTEIIAQTRQQVAEAKKQYEGVSGRYAEFIGANASVGFSNKYGISDIAASDAAENAAKERRKMNADAVQKTSGLEVKNEKIKQKQGENTFLPKQKLITAISGQINEDTKVGRLLKGVVAAKKGMRNGVTGAVGGLLGSVGNDIHQSIHNWKDSGGLGRKIIGGIADFGINALRHVNANRKYKKAKEALTESKETLGSLQTYLGDRLFEDPENKEKFEQFTLAANGIDKAIDFRRKENILNIETFGRFGTMVGGIRSEYDDRSLDEIRQDWAKQIEEGGKSTEGVYSDAVRLRKSIDKWIEKEYGIQGLSESKNETRTRKDKERANGFFGKLAKSISTASKMASDASSMASAFRKGIKADRNAMMRGFSRNGYEKGKKYLKRLMFGRSSAEHLAEKYAEFADAIDKNVPKMAVGGAVLNGIGSVLLSNASANSSGKGLGGVANRIKKGVLAKIGEAGPEAVLPLRGKVLKNVGKAIGQAVTGQSGGGKTGGMQYKSAQQMEDEQRAAENQADISKNVATIVQLIQEQNKLAKVKKPESLLSKILGFLGMMATVLLPKILGFIKFVWKGISFVGKILKPVVKLLSKVVGPLMKVLGMLGKGLFGILGGAGKALLKGAGGLLSGAKAGAGKIWIGMKAGAKGIGGKIGGAFKGAGSLAKGVLGKLGPIAMVGMGLYDAYKGWNDEDFHKRAFGLKDGEKASTGQKIQSGMAHAASGLTFGLIDPETFVEAYQNPLKSFGKMITGLTDGIPVLGDAVKGIGSFIESSPMLKGAIDFLDQHNPLKLMTEGIGKAIDWFNSDNKWEDLKNGFASIGTTVSDAFGKANEWIGKKAEEAWKFVKEYNPISLTQKGFESAKGWFDKAIPEAWNFIKENNPFALVQKGFQGIRTFFSEKFGSVANWLSGENNPFQPIFNFLNSIGEFFKSLTLSGLAAKTGLVPDFLVNWLQEKGLAQGGFVKASNGGTLAVIGEGGEDEAVLPLSKLAQVIYESFKLHDALLGKRSALPVKDSKALNNGTLFNKMFGSVNESEEPRAGWATDLLEEIKEMSKNIDLMTKMMKLIKVDGITLGELVENKMLQYASKGGGGIGAAAQAAVRAAESGSGGMANPASPSYGGGGGGGGGNPANVQPIDGGPAQVGADGFLSMKDMGSLAGKFESGDSSSTTVDNGDKAGTSFGRYQIAGVARRKEFLNYISKMGGEGAQIAQQLSAAGFVNSTGNNSQAAQLWKQMASAGKIQQYEDAFGKEMYFGYTYNRIKSQKAKDMIKNSPTLQKALLSYSLQGQDGAYVGINRDFKEGMSEKDLLLLMYNDRLRRAEANKNNFIPKGKKGRPLIVGLRNRLGEGAGSERNLALGMLAAEQQAKASGTFKNPAAAAQGQSPFTPQQQAEINANPMLQGADVKPYQSQGGGKVDSYINIARQFAATDQGYSQPQRLQEGHFDCSSLVGRSLNKAGLNINYRNFNTETMNPYSGSKESNYGKAMKDAGFVWQEGTQGMRAGDILWRSGHTVFYSGDGNIIGAHGKDAYINRMQDSVSEKRLSEKERAKYRGFWRYVGKDAGAVPQGVAKPAQQAPIQQVQPPKPQAPLQLPMIQRGQGPSAPPMALAMPRIEAPALSGMPYIPTAQPAAPTMQPVAQPVQGIPRMGGSPIGGMGLSSVYAAMTSNAMARGVKYKLGARNSQTGRVDCSGWTIEMQKQVMQGVQDPQARARLGHVLAGGTAEGIIARGLKYQGGMSASLDPSQIKEGTMIGIKARKGGWGSDRAMGIGHIVTTFRDPNTGRMMVSESTSRGSGGRSGVITTDYEQWYKQHAGRTMWGVDTGALIGGQFDAGNIKEQMAAGDAQQTQYGMGATPQSGPQIQASQQGQVNEQAAAYYAQGGAGGGNIDASTNINGGFGGGKDKPSVEMVFNKDPMGWIVLQGNAVH